MDVTNLHDEQTKLQKQTKEKNQRKQRKKLKIYLEVFGIWFAVRVGQYFNGLRIEDCKPIELHFINAFLYDILI